MSAILFILASVVASTLAAPSVSAPECVPDQAQFYWKAPCDGQTFTNRVTISSLAATQVGKPVDDQGGMDISTNLDLHAVITDQYGTVNKPLVDVGILEYSKGLSGKCEWKSVPTLGLLDNIDACTIIQNCHLTGSPTVLDASISIKTLAGPLYAGIDVNTYYGLTLTFKDDKTPFLCVYSQDLVIKK